MTVAEETRCRICGFSGPLTETGERSDKYAISVCPSCRTRHIADIPARDLDKLYDTLFSDGEYERHRVEFEQLRRGRALPYLERGRLLRSIERLCPGRSMAEIGGGTGRFGVLAGKRAWRYTNFDISPTAVKFCRDLGLQAEAFPPGETPPLPAGSLDAVVMWEVLEHVVHVRDYLFRIRESLRPGGVFLMSTPNYRTPALVDPRDWGTLSAPPIHINYFDFATLSAVLTAAGFASVKVLRRRFYRPALNARSIVRSVRFGLLLDEPETLYGICVR